MLQAKIRKSKSFCELLERKSVRIRLMNMILIFESWAVESQPTPSHPHSSDVVIHPSERILWLQSLARREEPRP
jgi:hypothetical protein